MRSTFPLPFPHTPSSSGVSRGSPRKAFSLVELSIVLVILGLLTGGILAGQSLIRAAELRIVPTEYQRYVAATQTFRDKYMALPGDMNNATRFWNRQVNQTWCVTNSAAAVTTPGTCDGNGNGQIGTTAAASQSGEDFQFWNQLAYAGLIEGSYTGLAGPVSAADSTPGVNVGISRMSNSGWDARFGGVSAGDGATYAMDYGNLLGFGGDLPGNNRMWGANLKPEEAWSIDTKIDDGKPSYGRMVIRFWNNACATGGSSETDLANSVYNLTNTSLQCTLYFPRAF